MLVCRCSANNLSCSCLSSGNLIVKVDILSILCDKDSFAVTRLLNKTYILIRSAREQGRWIKVEQNASSQMLPALGKVCDAGKVLFIALNSYLNIIYINDYAKNLLGWRNIQDILDRSFNQFWSSFHFPPLIDQHGNLLVSEPLMINHHAIQWQQLNSRELTEENIWLIGRQVAQSGGSENILELQMAKAAAEKASKAKSEFIENMSHDMKTPLSSVIGIADLLINKLEDKTCKEYAEDIKKSVSELLDLFNEVLNIMNKDIIDKPENVTFDLQELVQEIVDFLNPIIHEKNIQFKLYYAKNLHPNYLGNRFHLYRIILNLLSNAIKFTDPGGKVFLSVKKLKIFKRQETIQISVGDTGVGIPKESQKIIFDRYTRLTPSNKKKYQGSGLGLYIVKKMVDGIRGSITVKSQANKGSVFRLVTDLFQTEKMKQKRLAKAKFSNNTDSTFKNIVVLLVDNNPIAQKINKHLLLAQGCQVDIAETGQSAFEKFIEHEYALVLMDIVLPDSSGYGVTEKMRKYEKAQNKFPVPILGLTADVQKRDVDLAVSSGMNAVFAKPLSSELTKNILSQFLAENKFETQADIMRAKETELKVIDLKLGAEILASDTKAAKNMIEKLVQMLPGDLQKLKAAASEGDNQKLQDLAHYIKGGASYCGTPRLQKAAAGLERAIKVNAGSIVIAETYEKLCSEIAILLTEFSRLPS